MEGKLKFLDLDCCGDMPESFFSTMLLLHSSSLSSLRLDGCSFDFPGWMKYLVPLKQLRLLSLMHFSALIWKDEQPFFNELVCHDLREFRLYCEGFFDDENLETLVRKFPLLCTLDLSGHTMMTTDGVLKSIDRLKNLESLKIAVSLQCDSKEAQKLIKKQFPKIEKLSVL